MRLSSQMSGLALAAICHAIFAMMQGTAFARPLEADDTPPAHALPTGSATDTAMARGDAGTGHATTASMAPSHQPFELARSLHALQNQIALGSRPAFAAQHGLLTRLGQKMLAASPEVWARPANARAAITFVLSGGQPGLLRGLLKSKALPAPMTGIAQGTLAYATGHPAAAFEELAKVDARTLPPSLGAHLALAQGTLTMKSNPERATRYLETARLLAPGTLVEESALRRQITVASARADAKSFTFLTRQYIRRFSRSPYAAGFLLNFPGLWADLDLPDGSTTLDRLAGTLSGLDRPARRRVYLALARYMLLAGNRGLARFAATRASATIDAEADGGAAARASLYRAAAGIAGPDAAAAARALRAIDPTILPAPDIRLHAAALAVAARVQAPLAQVAQEEAPAGGSEPSALIARARAAIATADAVLATVK